MDEALADFLSKKSPEELLEIFKNFKGFAKRSPRRYGGEGDFGKALKALKALKASEPESKLDLDPSRLERNNVILRFKSQERISAREDVTTLYNQYIKDCPDNNETARLAWAVEKARQHLLDVLKAIMKAWHYQYNVETGEFELDHQTDRRLAFACYYWYENKARTERRVNIGLLELNYSPQGRQYKVTGAAMKLFFDEGPGAELIHWRSEDIPNEDGVLFLHLKDLEMPIYSHLVLYVGRNAPHQWKVITGTYSTVGRRHKDIPLAGVLLLEQQSKAQAVLDLHAAQQRGTTPVAPAIYSFLFRTRLRGTEETYLNIQALPSARELTFLEKYVGQYRGLYFRKAKSNATRSTDLVEKFLLDIYGTGDARIIVPALHGASCEYQGRVRVVDIKTNALVGYFDFLTRNNVYRFTIYFNKEFKGPQRDELYAVYAGIEREDPFVPVAGRMNFKRLPVPVPPEKQGEYLVSKEVEDAARDPDMQGYFRLFAGRSEHNYVETLSLPHEDPGPDGQEPFPYAGDYFVYFLSTNQSTVCKVPLKIHANGSVEMRTGSSHAGRFRPGTAAYHNSGQLTILLRPCPGDNTSSFLSFYAGNGYPEAVGHFFGVSSRFNEQNRPVGQLEVLVKANQDVATAPVETFLLYDAAYVNEDEQTRGLLSYLTGKNNRYITARRTRNAPFQRNPRHGSVYFCAACYLYGRRDFKEGLKNLYQAYVHGFGTDPADREAFEKELEHSFANTGPAQLKARPDNSGLPMLTFGELSRKITGRLPA